MKGSSDLDEWKGRRSGDEENTKGTTRNTLLLAATDILRWRNPSRQTYASFEIAGHWENWPVTHSRFKLHLVGLHMDRFGRPPTAAQLADVLLAFEAEAARGPIYETGLRVMGECNENGLPTAVYVDLGGEDWSAVRITAAGAEVVDRPPVKLCRSAAMRPLPEFAVGEDRLEDLLGDILNFASERDLQLAIGWLVAALRPAGPYPILLLRGESGAGKSFASRLLRTIIDPNAAPLRALPADERNLYVSIWNSWVLALDNVSRLDWLSDALARVSTRGGYAIRQLQTDTDEIIIEGARPILLNSVVDPVKAQDLASRCLLVELRALSGGHWRTETELLQLFHQRWPLILGALYTAVAAALRYLAETPPPRLNRMADAIHWVTAAEPGLGWAPGTFLAACADSNAELIENAIAGDPIGGAIKKLMATLSGAWSGTAEELLKDLATKLDDQQARSPRWPAAANVLASRLRRLAPALRHQGIEVEFFRATTSNRTRLITITPAPSHTG